MLLMTLGLAAVAVAAAHSHAAAAPSYSLYWTDAGDHDPPSSSAPWRRRLQDPMISFWMVEATYDSSGSVLSRRNVTLPHNGMGFVSVSPDGKRAMFASEVKQPQGWSNVDTLTLDLTAPGGPIGTAAVLLSSASKQALLAPCAQTKPYPCTQVSTFHGTFTPDGKSVIFAYRAWANLGSAVGSQALAIADADGSNARSLTYNISDTMTQDECPFITPDGERVLFMRVVGEHNWLAVYDVRSSAVSVRTDLPEVGEGAGCPAWLGPDEPNSFMWLGCNSQPCDIYEEQQPQRGGEEALEAQRWGVRRLSPRRLSPRKLLAAAAAAATSDDSGGGASARMQPHANGAPFTQYKITLSSSDGAPGGEKAQPMFPIFTTAAPSHIGVFETSQCDRVHGDPLAGSNRSIICQGADPTHLFFLKFGVDRTTGVAARNDTNTLRAVMTPRPYLLRYNAGK
jgi:hypothetical protein